MCRMGFLALTGFVLSGALGAAAEPMKTPATPAEALQTLPGFKVELIHTADPKTEGSWINMAKDDKGRLIISGQHGEPILRVTLKDGEVDKIEKLGLPISEAMGLLYAFDSLYVDGAGPGGYGLYRCKDTKGTGQFDEVKLLKKFNNGGGDHSAHAVLLGPDKMLYCLLGNFCDVPEGMAPDSPHRNYQEDLLLPRQPDGNGFAAGRFAPGGIILRTDPDGKKWDLMLGGFRNAYDMAFNADGELFTFDADMEWDWGWPWYRPTRINHCTSGAEFGWRNGAGKWPEYYPDSLGAVANVGLGSPTGLVFGAGAKFPAKYQKALFMCDWTYGRLFAAHLKPKGSSYTAEFENFLAPKALKSEVKTPLNLTDLVIGDDGAIYFTTGGRSTQSGLYRISYTGAESTAPADLHDAAGVKERAQRHALEAFHGKQDPKALDAAWPQLNSEDRALRYAARIAVEFQPVAEWKARALAEKKPEAALTALLALARCGPKEVQPDLLAALARFPLGALTEDQQLEKLRVQQLTFIRQGPPSGAAAKKVAAELDPAFPAKSEKVNHEIAEILIYFRAPHVAEKCLRLAAEAKTQEEELFYVYNLRTLPIGDWTLAQRKEYFGYFTKDHKRPPHSTELKQWFADVGRQPGKEAGFDGASFPLFTKHIFAEATANLSDAERKELAPLLASIDQADVVTYVTKVRPPIKDYKTAEIMPMLDKLDHGRNFDKGRQAYLDCQCVKCHRFGNEGGAVGPDLTAISSRFAAKDILESILEPSKVVSEQYQNIIVTTVSGKTIVGRLLDDTPQQLVVQPNPLEPERVVVPKSDLDTVQPSKVSPMPEHLVDGLPPDEILDLMAYLQSQGNPNYRAFQK